MLRNIALAMLGLAGCSAPAVAPRTSGDGSSLAAALVVTCGAGGADRQVAEYGWIRRNRPGARLVGQAELRQGGRTYDVVAIVLRGREEQLYFDVTAASPP
jgi:hypothetical protein